MDRTGGAAPVDSAWDPQGILNSVAISPDGKALAVGLIRGAAEDIWVKQLPAGTFSRVTFGMIHRRVSWRPMAARCSTWPGRRAAGPGRCPGRRHRHASESLSPPHGLRSGALSRDGRWLLLRRVVNEEGNGDIYALKRGRLHPVPLLTSPARETSPALSPDGKWLAYVSNESGKPEVYVRPFPDVGSAKWQVSLSGGFTPVWAHNGRELFYPDGTRAMVAVTVQPGPTFTVGQRCSSPRWPTVSPAVIRPTT